MDDFEKELKQGFLEEAEQAITEVEQCFLIFESNPEDKPTLDKIFRLAHNLKGSAKAVGFEEMGQFTHELESFLLKLKNNELKIKPSTVSLLLVCNDHLMKMVNELKQNMEASIDSSQIINAIYAHINGQDEVNEVSEETDLITPTPDTEVFPSADQFEDEAPVSEAIVNEVAQAVESFQETKTAVTFEEEVAAQALLIEEQIKAEAAPSAAMSTRGVEASKEEAKVIPMAKPEPKVAAPAPAPQPPAGASASAQATHSNKNGDDSIRVSLARVEKLLNFVGEMVILQAVLREQVTDASSVLMKKTIHQLGKVTKEVQDVSMSLRMVPVKPTFLKMQRIVRDTAQILDKNVQIKLAGEETELDKTVLERINDPLVHLIRNSVDHGIESKEARIAAGKNVVGEVALSAYHQSGKLVIEVKDDGGGLDAEKLKAHAIKKGVLKPNETLTEKQCYELIFKPGFSTKTQVTDISGRGVGMDVVRTNIEELGGDIQIESKLGQGTCFKIFLPLTLAIIDGMVVKSQGERYVIPISMVFESLRPAAVDVKFTSGVGEVLILRDQNLPIFRLANLLGKKVNTKAEDMIAIVVKSGNKPFAVLVDDIIGQYQVVIKQLGLEVQNIRGISGSTILGDGKPALIIEPIDLIVKDKSSNMRGVAV